jgi:hypothetical protein
VECGVGTVWVWNGSRFGPETLEIWNRRGCDGFVPQPLDNLEPLGLGEFGPAMRRILEPLRFGWVRV